jgi:adenosylcobinamide-GDP ribazoletransferase
MKGLISAIQFITVLPIGKKGTFDPDGMIVFFPVVGLIIGILLMGFDQIVLKLWPGPVAGLLDTVFLVAITGAFHLDGLGDTADGLYGYRTKKEALAIMKDSRIGAMGLVAIVCCLAVKCAGIMGLESHRTILLIIIPSYARSGMLFGFKFFKYGRQEGGTGQDFFKNGLKLSAFSGLLIPVLLSCFLGWKFFWLNLCFIVVLMIILLFYQRKLGCITGDMLGAMVEVIEAALFLIVSIKI